MTAQQVKSTFGGSWVLERSENFDEFLKAMGVTAPPRPSTKPTTEITVNGNDITIASVYGQTNRSETFQLGKPYMSEYQGTKALMVANLQGGQLITNPEDENPSLPTAVRSMAGTEMCLELRIGDVVSKRYFKRA